jgi:hypothetical protein
MVIIFRTTRASHRNMLASNVLFYCMYDMVYGHTMDALKDRFIHNMQQEKRQQASVINYYL